MRGWTHMKPPPSLSLSPPPNIICGPATAAVATGARSTGVSWNESGELPTSASIALIFCRVSRSTP